MAHKIFMKTMIISFFVSLLILALSKAITWIWQGDAKLSYAYLFRDLIFCFVPAYILVALVTYYATAHRAPVCACPTVDRRLENEGSDAETGTKMNGDPGKSATEKGESENIEQK